LKKCARGFLVSVLCVLWLVSPISPVLSTLRNPAAIRTDSQFDKIAELLLEMVRSGRNLRVLCDAANILNYYLANRPGAERIRVDWFSPHSREEDLKMYEVLSHGSYDVAVGERPRWVLYLHTGLTFSYTDSYLSANSTRILTFTAHTEGALYAPGPIYVFILCSC